MKEDRNKSQGIEEFGIKQANIVGYVEGIEDIRMDLKTICTDLIEELDAGDLPIEPCNCYCLGIKKLVQKVLEICRLRIGEAYQAQLELCEDVKRRARKGGEDSDS